MTRRSNRATKVRRPSERAPRRVPAVVAASPEAAEIAAALGRMPMAAAVLDGETVVWASEALARSLGLDPEAVPGRPLRELIPPEGSDLRLPGPGQLASYRARLDGVPARVDLSAVPGRGGRRLTAAVLFLREETADVAAGEALLELSRDLAAARTEDELTGGVARALEVLFPGRRFCIRLLDPATLALTSLHAHGRLRPGARERVVLRAAAVRKTGLSRPELEARGIAVAERDEPLFEGSERATALPLAVGGSLYGVLSLEYARGAPGDAAGDGALLKQVANHAALGLRNLRSIEELTFLKTYLEELIENANALILVVNRKRRITVFNRALTRLTAWRREEALGQDLLRFVAGADHERMERVLGRSLEGEPVTSFETRVLLRSGEEAQVAFNTAPIAGPGGEVEGVIAIGQDLTALRLLEERAEHYQKLASFGRLAAGVVHELNNPLTAIVSYSEAMLQKYRWGGLDAADQEKLRRIKESGERIDRFSRDLITYARPSTDRVERIDVGALMEQAAAMCEPVLRATRARLQRQIEPTPPIAGVRGSLLQVFVNLVTNGAHALRDGGTVTLRLSAAGETVVAQVSDDGGGMPPEVKSHIFEPFFTTKPDGTGLGLPIVQGIVTRHGGTITVDSVLGAGTTFTVVLPRNPPDA